MRSLAVVALEPHSGPWRAVVEPYGWQCRIPCRVWTPVVSRGEIRITKEGDGEPAGIVYATELAESERRGGTTTVFVEDRTSTRTMVALSLSGLGGMLFGALIVGQGEMYPTDDKTFTRVGGSVVAGVGLALLVAGIAVGPREKTIVWLDGREP